MPVAAVTHAELKRTSGTLQDWCRSHLQERHFARSRNARRMQALVALGIALSSLLLSSMGLFVLARSHHHANSAVSGALLFFVLLGAVFLYRTVRLLTHREATPPPQITPPRLIPNPRKPGDYISTDELTVLAAGQGRLADQMGDLALAVDRGGDVLAIQRTSPGPHRPVEWRAEAIDAHTAPSLLLSSGYDANELAGVLALGEPAVRA